MSTSIEIPPGSGDFFVFPDQFQGPGYLTRFPELCTALAALSQGAIDDAAAAQLAAAMAQTFALTSTTSATPRTIGTGSMSFTMAAPLPLIAGNYALIASQANPATNWMWGQVTSNVSQVLTVSVTLTGGAGTFSDWQVQLSAPRGPTGATGGVTSVAGRTGVVTLAVADVSGAAPLASPALTGTPTAPTATAGTNTTQLATTQFVQTAVGGAGVGVNRIINGDHRVQQVAGTTTVNSGTRVFPIDRWGASGTASAGVFTVQRATGGSGFAYWMTATVTTAAASPSAAHTYLISQRIEGPNVADLGWGAAGAASVTLSFIVKSSLTGTFSGVVRNSAQNRSYPFTYTIASANTNTVVSVTIPGDTSGTWLTAAGTIGLEVVFCLGSGSTGLGTAATWAAAAYVGATGSVNVMGTLSATWSVTNVQLERATIASIFEARPYGQEFELCLRYFQVFGEGQSSTQYAVGMSETVSSGLYYLPLIVPMAAAPTMSFLTAASDFTLFNPGGSGQVASGITVTYADSRVVVLTATTASGMTQGYASRLISLTTASRIYARAEL